MSTLPEPDADQIALSRALMVVLRDQITQAGGALPFDRYMQSALYEPGLGYYVAGQRRFGAAGDFVTAPELSPLFGRCLATQLAQWFDAVAPVIWEFGAGTGALAAQLLTALAEAGCPPERYAVIEVSGDLRSRQQHWLETHLPRHLFDRVEWLDRLPDTLEGVVLGNEVLDAMPVRLFEWSDERVYERWVTERDGRFEWSRQPADPHFGAAVRRRLEASTWPFEAFGRCYRSELGEQAAHWVRTIGERLTRGAMLLIDYGFPARELYHPQRDQGSLICHYRHRTHHDPFWWPGLSDITTHVDFSALNDEARASGLDLLGYTSQAHFLLGCGLLEHFAAETPDSVLERARQAQALQQLVSEAEMGELFKVIAFGRAMEGDPPIGFSARDRSATLG
jgi:SAM-dependent MidA family methyltransferase